MESTFYVWVTFVTKSAIDSLIVSLVRQGFAVEPLASDDSVTIEGDFGCLGALSIRHDKIPANRDKGSENLQAWVLNIIAKILTDRKSSWHSIVVHQVGGPFTWKGPSYFIPDDTPKPPPASQLEKVERVIGDDHG